MSSMGKIMNFCTRCGSLPQVWQQNMRCDLLTYIVFIRIPPLLDVLHNYFLHGPPWHDALFCGSPFQQKTRFVLQAIKANWKSLYAETHSLWSVSCEFWMQQLRSLRKWSRWSTSDFLSHTDSWFKKKCSFEAEEHLLRIFGQQHIALCSESDETIL